MKTKVEYAVYDARAIADVCDGVCLAVEPTLDEARKVAKQCGGNNCIYKMVSEKSPKDKYTWICKSETFVEIVK
jgi:3-keto-L-gulonate-6-phosphate decarboxylase